jgi:hypothetical protein
VEAAESSLATLQWDGCAGHVSQWQGTSHVLGTSSRLTNSRNPSAESYSTRGSLDDAQ